MTARQLFEGLLTELSKVNAPSMLLQDFNYFANKAIQQYINKRYNIYDISQQTTDDLRVLKASALLNVNKVEQYPEYNTGLASLFGAYYEVELPDDYIHMLNCICIYRINGGNYKCFDDKDYVQFAAKRLTADSWSQIINDFYNRPLPERPYYYIHEVNTQQELPYNPYKEGRGNDQAEDNGIQFTLEAKDGDIVKTITATRISETEAKVDDSDITFNITDISIGDSVPVYYNPSLDSISNSITPLLSISFKIKSIQASRIEYPRTISLKLGNNKLKEVDRVDRPAYLRAPNPTKVRCEIRYGKDSSVFVLEKVLVDYIKAPQQIRLTQEQIDLTRDTSQILEFPDYVCQEIGNELALLVMENIADPRLQTHTAVTQSIAQPTQNEQPSK